MKRFASHYLFLSLRDRYSNYYVELSKERVVKTELLEQEIESTVWLNGSILLFPALLHEPDSDLTFGEVVLKHVWDLSQFIDNIDMERKIYAYYAPYFEIRDMLNLPITDFLLLTE